jgi:hypothetical protein
MTLQWLRRPPRRWLKRFLFLYMPGLVLLGMMIGFLLFFGQFQWPGLHWDGAFFATPVLRFSSEGHWKFGSYTHWLITKPSRLYDFHGFLHVILFGKLLKADTWKDQFFWISILNVVTLLAYFFLFDRALRRSRVASFSLAVLFSFVPAVILLGIQGRPEHLQLLLVAVPFLFWELTAKENLALRSSYVIAGLMFIASPLPGLAYGVLVLLVLLVRVNGNCMRTEFIREFLLFSLIAIITAILAIEAFTPLSMASWLNNLLDEGVGVLGFEGMLSQFYEHRLGFTMIVPFWNLLLVVSLFIIFVFLLERRQFIVIAIGFTAFLYFNKKMADYGYICFLPMLLVFAADWLRVARGHSLAGIRYRWVLAFATFVAAVYAFVFVQYALFSLALHSERHNLDLSRSRLDGLVGEYRNSASHVAVGYPAIRAPSFVVLGDGGDRFIDLPYSKSPQSPNSWLSDYESSTRNNVRFYVLPLPSRFSLSDVPASLYVGDRRFDRIYVDRPLPDSPFTRFIVLERLRLAYHMAVFRAVSDGGAAAPLTASPSPRPPGAPGR